MNAPKTVAVVGGGLAGLSAACALADAGCNVSVFERRPYLGGRASSYEHPGTGEFIDNCQHVLLGCCTNLTDFYSRIGVLDKIRWYDRLTFLEPGGRRSEIAGCGLPAPLHAAPSFLGAPALSVRDKLAITRAMLAMLGGVPDEAESFGTWLRRHGQTESAVRRFWEPVLVGALNDDAEHVSAAMAGFVFREAFLNSARAGQMGVATVPLTALYAAAGAYIRQRGGAVFLRTSIQRVFPDGDQVRLQLPDGELAADAAVLAVPQNQIAALLQPAPELEPLLHAINRFTTSPITGIHLWFDREITDLDHAVLLDRTIQWMFHKSRIFGRPGSPSYVELVVSSSKALVRMTREEIIATALRELAEFFPIVSEARLVKSTVVKELHATFTAAPGLERLRPGPSTPWPNLVLAGDWIATRWPATMESAVRGGYLAAGALLGKSLLIPDLPPSGFMRLFANRG